MKTLQQGYKKVTILEMISKLESPIISIKLRDVQVTELNRLSTKNSRKKILLNTEVKYLKQLYQNFVLNGFSFKDKTPVFNKINNKKKVQHIGLRMLNNMTR